MWWSRTIKTGAKFSFSGGLVLLVIAAVAACGFRPVYRGGSSGEVATELSQVDVAVIPDRNGQILRNHLLDEINPRGGARPEYELRVNLFTTKQERALSSRQLATRANVRFRAEYFLRHKATREQVFKTESEVVSSYNIVDSEFGTLSALRDAEKRGLRQLSQVMATRLRLYFDSRAR